MHAYAYTDAHADINTRRLIYLHNFGSCSLCFSSASRRILVVVVREQMHQCPPVTLSLNLSHLNLDPHTVATFFYLLRTQPYCYVTHHLIQSRVRAHARTHTQLINHQPQHNSFTHSRHPSILAAIHPSVPESSGTQKRRQGMHQTDSSKSRLL